MLRQKAATQGKRSARHRQTTATAWQAIRNLSFPEIRNPQSAIRNLMSDKPASQATEQATPERLKKAKEEGQIAQSQEVPTALIVVILLVAMTLMAPSLYRFFISQMQQGLTSQLNAPLNVDSMHGLLRDAGAAAMIATAPLLVVLCLISVASSLLSGGWSFSTKAIELKWERISPIEGVKNLVSLKSFVHMLISFAKLAVISLIAWLYIREQMPTIQNLHWSTPAGLMGTIGQLLLGAAGRITVALMVIAGADLLYQRWNHKKQLMMTKQEVKEERKNYELPMEVKSRMRAMAISMSRKRMAQAVPTADVIITNPTHYAVALKYEPGGMSAPVVVAKGADHMCQTIKEIAARHDIPIVEKPELARALYASVKEGQAVPESLFVAVAEVLAMIYRLRQKKRLGK